MGKNSPPNYYTAKQNQRINMRNKMLEYRVEQCEANMEIERLRAESALRMLTEAKQMHAAHIKHLNQLMGSIRFSARCWAMFTAQYEHKDEKFKEIIRSIVSDTEALHG